MSGKYGKKGIYCSQKCSSSVNGFQKGNTVGLGEKNGRWQGGKTRLSSRIHNLNLYYEWRKAIFKRDKYRCVLCNKPSKGDIEADHKTPAAQLLTFFKIETIEEAINCLPLWDINNGRTLCKECHKNTETYGSKYFKYIKSL